MITYLIGVDVVANARTPLDDEEPSFRLIEISMGVVVSE